MRLSSSAPLLLATIAAACSAHPPQASELRGGYATGEADGTQTFGALWPQATLPYEFAPGVTPEFEAGLRRAIGAWDQAVPGLKFVAHTDEVNFMTFSEDINQSEFIGRRREAGSQFLHATSDEGAGDPEVSIFGHALHELGHALGLIHEHSRCDSGRYLDLLRDDQLGLICAPAVRLYGPYNYESIMHYAGFTPRADAPADFVGDPGKMGQRERITPTDAATVAHMYGLD